MSIFLNDFSGSFDYFRGRGNKGQSVGIADEFTKRLTNRMSRFGKIGQTESMEYTKDIISANFKDEIAFDAEESFKEAEAKSMEAVAAIAASKVGGKSKSLSEYVAKTQQRRQNLQKAQAALAKSKALYEPKGSRITYDETGYKPIEIDEEAILSKYDQQIQERRDAYAAEFGTTYDEAAAGKYRQELSAAYFFTPDRLAQMEDWEVEYYQDAANASTPNAREYIREGFVKDMIEKYGFEDTRMGQRDIDDAVMADLIGISREDLARLNTYEGVGTTATDFTAEQMNTLRDFYLTSKVSSIRSANERAAAEDEFRRRSAEETQRSAIASQIKGRDFAAKNLQASSDDIELDENFMKNVGAFASVPKKRKVPKISFAEDRPI